MKIVKIYLIPILILTLNNCSTNSENEQIKTKSVTIYSAKYIDGEYLKDSIKIKYEIGFNENGDQNYFLPFIGYGNVDTNFTIPKYEEKVVDSITYYYDLVTKKLDRFIVDKEDSSLEYSALENYDPYLNTIYIYDSERHLVKHIDLLMKESESYFNAKYNNNDDLIYSVIQIDFHPNKRDRNNLSKEKLYLKLSQREYKIKEINYTYY